MSKGKVFLFIWSLLFVFFTASIKPVDASETLTLMPHDSFDVSKDLIQKFENENNVTLRFLKSGDAGAALIQAILSKDNPLADVFFGVDNTFLSRALSADLFVPYDSPLLSKIKNDLILDPKDKDTTGLELAMGLALQEGAEEVYLFGVLGKRWDMSLANIMLAAGDKYKDIKVSLFSDHSIIRVHHPQKTYILKSKQGQSISFLSLNTEVTNVSLQGFAYPLNDENLRFGSTRGISNIITGNQATEKHQTAILLCVEHI